MSARATTSQASTLLALLLLVSSCRDDGRAALCVPGEQKACACPGTAATGAQRCRDDGSGFERCEGCDASAPDLSVTDLSIAPSLPDMAVAHDMSVGEDLSAAVDMSVADDLSASIDLATACVPSCATHLDCQNSCPAPSIGVSCCDPNTHQCYSAQALVCPAPPDLAISSPY